MKKINEIFYSLQGEGYNTGTPAVFVRFSGCNLNCSFCDTNHNDGVMMSDEEIISSINQHAQSKLIVLTGGEPSLYISHDFIQMLKEKTGMKIAIETNGTHILPDNIDWVTFSPKTGFDGGNDFPAILTECNELKVVYVGQDLNEYFAIKADNYFLQPCFCEDAEKCRQNIEATVKAVLDDPRWRLSLQTHRMLGIR
jgi:7-carboxy-7-deazaguanine synthase